MDILITGGAGYIGSVAVKKLVKDHNVVVIDNLSKGKKELVDKSAIFYNVDLCDKKSLFEIFAKHDIKKVIHFAGYKAVEESMVDAVKYSDNLVGTINLLNAMVKSGCKSIIYSSSAAVYGIPVNNEPINESSEIKPINYYGYSKKSCENEITWYSKIHGIQYCLLRYFNVAGDGGLNYVDPDAKNILPIVMEVLSKKREKLTVFGDDYNTKDGTCIRDYIDVTDLVDAHILALNLKSNETINLGSSNGFSVLDLIKATEEVTGKKVNFEIGSRRAGDPAILTASNKKAKELLNWVPKKDINKMIKSTYNSYSS